MYFVPLLVHALIDGSSSLGLAAPGADADAGAAPRPNDRHCGRAETQLTAVLLSAVPFGTAAAAALALGASSEARHEQRQHIALPLLAGGAAFALMPAALRLRSRVPAFVCLTAGVVAADATTGPFWTWVHHAAAPGTQATAFAAVNSAGKAGGALGPLSFGLLLAATGTYLPPIMLVAAALLAAGALAWAYPGDRGGDRARR